MTAPRFAEAPDWRIGIGDLDCKLITFVEAIATQKRGRRRRRGPGSFSFVVPSDDPRVQLPYVGDGYTDPAVEAARRTVFLWRRDFDNDDSDPWTLREAYVLATTSDEGDENDTTTACSCVDAWGLLYGRPVVTTSGSLPDPDDDYEFVATPGNEIVQQLVSDSIAYQGDFFVDALAGTFEETSELTISFRQGTTIGEALEQIARTETLDIYFTPVYDPDGRPGIIADLNVVSRRGADKPNLLFAYGMATDTIRRVSRVKDGTPQHLANDIRLFGGPGGQYVAETPSEDATSIARHRRYVAVDFITEIRHPTLLAELADEELAFRKDPQELLSFTPANDAGPVFLTDYDVGDAATVWIPNRLRRAEQGLQRIDGITWTVDDEDNEVVDAIEAFPSE